MMTVLVVLAFGGLAFVSMYAMMVTIVPEGGRIVQALRGEPRARFAPLTQLARAERRIAVRRWAAMPAVAPQRRAAA